MTMRKSRPSPRQQRRTATPSRAIWLTRPSFSAASVSPSLTNSLTPMPIRVGLALLIAKRLSVSKRILQLKEKRRFRIQWQKWAIRASCWTQSFWNKPLTWIANGLPLLPKIIVKGGVQIERSARPTSPLLKSKNRRVSNPNRTKSKMMRRPKPTKKSKMRRGKC